MTGGADIGRGGVFPLVGEILLLVSFTKSPVKSWSSLDVLATLAKGRVETAEVECEEKPDPEGALLSLSSPFSRFNEPALCGGPGPGPFSGIVTCCVAGICPEEADALSPPWPPAFRFSSLALRAE